MSQASTPMAKKLFEAENSPVQQEADPVKRGLLVLQFATKMDQAQTKQHAAGKASKEGLLVPLEMYTYAARLLASIAGTDANDLSNPPAAGTAGSNAITPYHPPYVVPGCTVCVQTHHITLQYLVCACGRVPGSALHCPVYSCSSVDSVVALVFACFSALLFTSLPQRSLESRRKSTHVWTSWRRGWSNTCKLSGTKSSRS